MVELMELSNRRMVEWLSWWGCRIVEVWNDGMTKLVELSNHRIEEWWNHSNGTIGVVVESSKCGMVEWCSC